MVDIVKVAIKLNISLIELIEKSSLLAYIVDYHTDNGIPTIDRKSSMSYCLARDIRLLGKPKFANTDVIRIVDLEESKISVNKDIEKYLLEFFKVM